jgi:hypothetical protein
MDKRIEARRKQVLEFRMAGAKRELESLFRFAGWSKSQARREVSSLAARWSEAHNGERTSLFA